MDGQEPTSHPLQGRLRRAVAWPGVMPNNATDVLHDRTTTVHEQALDSLNAALFAIDSSGDLLFANRAGDEMLRARRWVQLNGRTLTSGRAVREAQDFGEALMTLRRGQGVTSVLTSHDGVPEILMSTLPISNAGSSGHGASAAAGIVWLITGSSHAGPLEHFARAFNLTKAEARLLGYLIAGFDLRSAASALKVSVHTVRNQLKSVFRKTGRHRQSQLLTLFGRLSALRSSV